MHFKTMEIQGFKSFADKTVLNFDTKMTAIVGSNGNGKSNISDALRWVMGEQGAKSLRGDKMEDVIFHGTVSRKSMGFAKVSLSIDNLDRALNIDSDEVVITRKLYRTGDSEYLINGAKCRLKDVQEMLLGTGLGRDGYSIIGQGRVAEVINSKVAQRRELFEEAAGVSKFLHRKAESERELEKAEDNILRLKDIAEKDGERIPVLEKQCEKARKAKLLMDSEKELDISLGVYDLDRIEAELGEIDKNILANQGECEHYEREISELEAESEEVAEQKLLHAAKLDELRRSNDIAKDRIAEINQQIAVYNNEISHNNSRIEAIKQQIKNSEKSTAEFEQQIVQYRQEIDNKNKLLEDIDSVNSQLAEKLEGIGSESGRLDDEYKELDRKIGSLYAKQTEYRLTLSTAQSSLEELQQQQNDAGARFENQDVLIAEYRENRKNLRLRLDEILENKQELENKVGGYTKLLDSKQEKFELARREFENKRRTCEQKNSKLHALRDVDRNMSGYYSSVKAIITASKTGRISDIHGTIADIIHVDGKFTTAVEIALGAALQNIIVGSEETAKRCIRYLKENNAGRATFLPLTSIKGNTLFVNGLAQEQGYYGLGSEIVSYDSRYENIIKSVLGKIAIVDDIDTATYIAKKYGYKFRIVTLDGQVINSGGSFTGGSVKNTTDIISRKQELETLEKEVTELTDVINITKSSFTSLQAEVNKLNIEIDGYKEQLSVITNEEIRISTEIDGISKLIVQSEEQQENSEAILDRFKAQISVQENIISDSTAQLEKITAELEENNQLIEKSSELLQQSVQQRQLISDKISEMNIEKIGLAKDIENLQNQITSAETNKKNIGSGNEQLIKEITQLEQSTIDIASDIEKAKIEAAAIDSSFKDNSGEINAVVQKNAQCEQRVGEINREIREKSDAKEKFSNALVIAKEKKATAENEVEKIKSRMWDNYEITPSEAKNEAAEIEDVIAARAELQDIHRRITALGTVNYAAIEEFEEVSTRYAEMMKQLNDLEKSRDDLQKLIENLTTDIKTRFLDSFNDINEHFKRLFSEIFSGGHAHLELTDPNDILNTGIEIFAAPPGKVINNLSLLSGGEQTMVAITIYFAILLHRPTPFCMLDEVDAALDEANVTKYVTYLRRFSANTQLMVITHRRGTIEGCDVLYGVFMQEKGVSRLLRQEIIDDLDMELS